MQFRSSQLRDSNQLWPSHVPRRPSASITRSTRCCLDKLSYTLQPAASGLRSDWARRYSCCLRLSHAGTHDLNRMVPLGEPLKHLGMEASIEPLDQAALEWAWSHGEAAGSASSVLSTANWHVSRSGRRSARWPSSVLLAKTAAIQCPPTRALECLGLEDQMREGPQQA